MCVVYEITCNERCAIAITWQCGKLKALQSQLGAFKGPTSVTAPSQCLQLWCY